MIRVDSLETLTDLVKLMKKYDLTEIDLSDDSESVLLRRGGSQQPVMMQAPAAAPAQAPVTAHAPEQPTGTSKESSAPADDDAGLHAITSPMVGTFYAAADPESPPFIKPGDSVTPDSTVCIVEAMKVFSEIKAECTGVVEKVLVKNSDPVEFGQKLFLVRPS
ncbi:MAG: acetyl-CoA carboxylase biotin carboxyl carrier protein [Phycisphaerales bacterium]